MNEEQLQHYRERLTKLRQETLDEAERVADDSAPVELDQSRVGRLSRMDAMQQQAMAKAQKQRRELQLKRIEGAFQRIEAGNYGQCVKCGEAIAEERMEFDPTAFFCPPCAEKAKR